MQRLLDLYSSYCGMQAQDIKKLQASGSNREYYRLFGENGKTLIGAIGTSKEENHAFIYLSHHFAHQKLPVPKVLAASSDESVYLQEDLGSNSLYDALKGGRESQGRYNKQEKELLFRVVRALPKIQIIGSIGLDWSNCYPQKEFDSSNVLFDLNYFKYCFLKPTNLDFHELKLEADFRLFAKDLVLESADSFMYRDFQARNVMLDEKANPFFIDFQGGRKGPYYYDVASFIWQASANYSYKLRRELVYEYYNSLKNYIEVPSVRHFVNRLSLFVLFRTLQVLGAYGYRGYFERKQHFIDSIPPAIKNLKEMLDLDVYPYPYMVDMLKRLTLLPKFNSYIEVSSSRKDGLKTITNNIYKVHPEDGPATFSKFDNQGKLVVRVYSFSYRKGIPEDPSGNGGGYVFDCRSTHNPGRYERYKNLTGLDEEVIRFLEDDAEILTFLDNIYKLADHHVERYIQRGFTSLMFSFGCTGGQHRSVYSAEHLAEHISKKYGIEVNVIHREQNIFKTFKAQD